MTCWDKENVNLPSLRTGFIDQPVLENEFFYLSVFTGEICNLGCRMCKPECSSLLRQEFKVLFDYLPEHSTWNEQASEVQTVKDVAKYITTLKFRGGEPFLTDSSIHLELLQYLVDIGRSTHVSIEYSTNATVFPDKKYFRLWEHFKDVTILVSIEDFGNRYEYNRYKANWDSVLQNILKLKETPGLTVKIASVINIFTIFYLPEFLEEMKTHGFTEGNIQLTALKYPECYLPNIAPMEVNYKIQRKLMRSKSIHAMKFIDTMNTSAFDNHFKSFVNRTQAHDKYRKQSFSKTFPELYELIKDYWSQ